MPRWKAAPFPDGGQQFRIPLSRCWKSDCSQKLPHSQTGNVANIRVVGFFLCSDHATSELLILLIVLLGGAKHFLAQQLSVISAQHIRSHWKPQPRFGLYPVTSHLVLCCIPSLCIWFLLRCSKQTLSRVNWSQFQRLLTTLLLLCLGRSGRISAARAVWEASARREYPSWVFWLGKA